MLNIQIVCRAPDKRGYPYNILLFLHQNICCGYSFKVPCQSTSSEYPHIFIEYNSSTFLLKKKGALSGAMSISSYLTLLLKLKNGF